MNTKCIPVLKMLAYILQHTSVIFFITAILGLKLMESNAWMRYIDIPCNIQINPFLWKSRFPPYDPKETSVHMNVMVSIKFMYMLHGYTMIYVMQHIKRGDFEGKEIFYIYLVFVLLELFLTCKNDNPFI